MAVWFLRAELIPWSTRDCSHENKRRTQEGVREGRGKEGKRERDLCMKE